MNALRCAALMVLFLLGSLAMAADPEDAPATGRRSEPAVQRVVVEDDGARIEELRVRGQTQRISVTPKGVIRQPYEILPADGGRDLAPSGQAARAGAAGQRVWHVLSF